MTKMLDFMQKPIRALIVDDEAYYIDKIKDAAACSGHINLCGSCQDPHQASDLITELKPDCLFLDVEMPELSGFQLFMNIRDAISWPMYVVFLAADDKYLLEALKMSGFDYLPKSFNSEAFDVMLQRLVSFQGKALSFNSDISTLPFDSQSFIVSTSSGFRFIRIHQIGFFSYIGSRKLWQGHLCGGEIVYLHRGTKAEDIQKYASSLRIIGQNLIVNCFYLDGVEDNYCKMLPPFSDERSLKVSRGYLKNLIGSFKLI